MKKRQQPIGLDIFCGVGGLSLGFENVGFNIVAAFDNDPMNTATYSENLPAAKAVCADISKISGKEIRSIARLGNRRVDVLFGGPPCQGFSMIGKRRIDDVRNTLLFDFARLVREIKPSYFVLENVPGILKGDMKKNVESFLRRVKRAGYLVVEPIRTVNAMDFGVPQRRHRVIIFGYKKHLVAPNYPKPSLEGERIPSVWDAIGDLAPTEKAKYLFEDNVYSGKLGKPSHYARMLREDNDTILNRGLSGCQMVSHSPQTIKRFAKTAPGSSEPISHFFRLEKTGVAPTLRAGSDRSHGLFTAARPIHPTFPRCITTREAARLHSFPDWFEFHPKKCHGFRQIGNSVPPLMSEAIARSIYTAIYNP